MLYCTKAKHCLYAYTMPLDQSQWNELHDMLDDLIHLKIADC